MAALRVRLLAPPLVAISMQVRRSRIGSPVDVAYGVLFDAHDGGGEDRGVLVPVLIACRMRNQEPRATLMHQDLPRSVAYCVRLKTLAAVRGTG